MTLAGKKVVVIGGSSGIGLATAELAKREGADVIIASRNAERLDVIAEKLPMHARNTGCPMPGKCCGRNNGRRRCIGNNAMADGGT